MRTLTERPPYNLKDIEEHAQHKEQWRLTGRVDILGDAYASLLGSYSLSALLRILQRKGRKEVAPLEVAVQRVSEQKRKVDE